jgi:hypothetical protein
MFFAKTPTAFFRHLPTATSTLVREAGDVLPLSEIAEASADLQGAGMKLETFDTGPILLISESAELKRKIEVFIENDNPSGDEEEIQLGVRVTRDREPVSLPVLPTITCTMKSEAGVWRVNEVAVTLRVPIGDTEFLKNLAAGSKKSHAIAQESSAVAVLRTLNTGEVSYAAVYPDIGYTCALADLGSDNNDTPGPHGAMLIDKVLASGIKDGYLFEMRGCTGSPVGTYQIVATPAMPDDGGRAFCTDESAVIRYADDGQASSCVSNGLPLE